jgi:hypothetical protein
MWIRITCPNGHSLEAHQMKRAARTGTCPECHAIVSMWTRVNCPNGHALKVRTKHGGQAGKCPQCAAAVKIPELSEEQLFAMIDALDKSPTAAAAVHQDPKHDTSFQSRPLSTGDSSLLVGSTMLKRLRSCPKCHKQFSAKYTICPHCRTFLPIENVGEAAEIVQRSHAIHCPGCGVTGFPGATVCTNCGMSLVVE